MATTKAQAESRTIGFTFVSTALHAGMVIAVLTMSIPEVKKFETTEISILEPSSFAAAPTPSEPLKAEPVVSIPAETEPPISGTVVKTIKAPRAAKSPVVKAAKRTAPPAAPKAEAPPVETFKQESPMVLPVAATLPEDQPEELETSPFLSSAAPELKDEDISEDLNKIDHEQNAKIAAVQSDLDSNIDKELAERESQLAALQQENQEKADQMALENAEKRAQERAALAAAQAKARADADAQALAAEKARAAAAAQAGAEQAAKKQAASGVGGGAAGSSNVRSLQELRQVPGNKRPQYDSQDRLHQRQGEVGFLAYVSRAGSITQFKMIQSSGHRQLDAKTLKAIRDWKFYPGQEGWVEIPFKWDLKGGPQEMPTTLRRSLTKN